LLSLDCSKLHVFSLLGVGGLHQYTSTNRNQWYFSSIHPLKLDM
jgi:hypothetical protein